MVGDTPLLILRTGPCDLTEFLNNSFENTEYSMDEISSMAHRHTGTGGMHTGDSAPPPTEKIHTTLSRGKSEVSGDQNSVEYSQWYKGGH